MQISQICSPCLVWKHPTYSPLCNSPAPAPPTGSNAATPRSVEAATEPSKRPTTHAAPSAAPSDNTGPGSDPRRTQTESRAKTKAPSLFNIGRHVHCRPPLDAPLMRSDPGVSLQRDRRPRRPLRTDGPTDGPDAALLLYALCPSCLLHHELYPRMSPSLPFDECAPPRRLVILPSPAAWSYADRSCDHP